MNRLIILIAAIMLGTLFAQAGLGRVAKKIRAYKYPIMGAAARSAQRINTYKDYPYYAPTDSASYSTLSIKDIVEENKVEPDYTVAVITAIAALAIVCIGGLFVASLVSDRKSQRTSYSACSTYKVRPEPATRKKYIMLANGGGTLVI